jgi:hypothetical protein
MDLLCFAASIHQEEQDYRRASEGEYVALIGLKIKDVEQEGREVMMQLK